MLRRYILKRTSLSRDSNEEERRLKVRRGSNGSGRTGVFLCVYEYTLYVYVYVYVVYMICVFISLRVVCVYVCSSARTHYWCGPLNFKGPQRKRGISTFREDRRVASFVVRNDETDGISIGKWTEPTMGFFNVSRKYGNLRNSKAMKRKRTLVKLSPAANANSFFYTGRKYFPFPFSFFFSNLSHK